MSLGVYARRKHKGPRRSGASDGPPEVLAGEAGFVAQLLLNPAQRERHTAKISIALLSLFTVANFGRARTTFFVVGKFCIYYIIHITFPPASFSRMSSHNITLSGQSRWPKLLIYNVPLDRMLPSRQNLT